MELHDLWILGGYARPAKGRPRPGLRPRPHPPPGGREAEQQDRQSGSSSGAGDGGFMAVAGWAGMDTTPPRARGAPQVGATTRLECQARVHCLRVGQVRRCAPIAPGARSAPMAVGRVALSTKETPAGPGRAPTGSPPPSLPRRRSPSYLRGMDHPSDPEPIRSWSWSALGERRLSRAEPVHYRPRPAVTAAPPASRRRAVAASPPPRGEPPRSADGAGAGGLRTGSGFGSDTSLPFHAPQPPTDRVLEHPSEGYVTSNDCRACHPGQYATWHESYHSTMTQVVEPGTVQATNEGDLRVRGRDYRLERRGTSNAGSFPVDSPGGGDISESKTVRLTQVTGSHHMQVFWYSFGDQRGLGIVVELYFHLEERRRINLVLGFHAASSTPRRTWALEPTSSSVTPPTRLTHAGNAVCAATAAAETEVGEYGISLTTACHGPGDVHAGLNRNRAAALPAPLLGLGGRLHRPPHPARREGVRPRLRPVPLGPCAAAQAVRTRAGVRQSVPARR